jgi:solute carrier family 45 protein 1/2/4
MLKEPIPAPAVQETRPTHIRNFSAPNQPPTYGERQPLIRSRSFDEYDINAEDDMPETRLAGGTVLGIHNLAVVIPQFIVRYFRNGPNLT